MIKQKHMLERRSCNYPVTFGTVNLCLRNPVKKLMEKAKKLYCTNEVETFVNTPKPSWDVISK